VTRPIITFLSDFGYEDWFVGVIHGVLHETCPDARVVDLNHAGEPGNIERAAFVLEASASDFPPDTVHLAVVDPGVGTSRRALAVRAHGQYFVGPDNGLLEWAFVDPEAATYSLTIERWFRTPVSRTFHGRDVFAPVAGHLAGGVSIDTFGPLIRNPVRLARHAPAFEEGELRGRITFIDRFGNALTNVTREALARAFPRVPEHRIETEVGGRVIPGIASSYGDAPIGTLVVIMGSSGRLEIAQVGGHAAMRFGFGERDLVTVRVV
jgi:S-adenosyl-L-methionine hydrolase (adenosine-forming)